MSDSSIVSDFLATTIREAYKHFDLVRFHAAEKMAIDLKTGKKVIVSKSLLDALEAVAQVAPDYTACEKKGVHLHGKKIQYLCEVIANLEAVKKTVS